MFDCFGDVRSAFARAGIVLERGGGAMSRSIFHDLGPLVSMARIRPRHSRHATARVKAERLQSFECNAM
jgi:hypothetical protein